MRRGGLGLHLTVVLVIVSMVVVRGPAPAPLPAIHASSPSLGDSPHSFGATEFVGASATANSSAGWENVSALNALPHPTGGLGVMTWDAADGYVLWFGAESDSNGTGYIAETWTYLGGSWANLTSNLTLSPPPLQGVGLTYDAADGYVLLFGGFEPGNLGHPSLTWSFHAGAWTNLTSTAGAPPPGEFGPAMTYDASAGFVLLAAFGRDALGNSTFQTWSFSGGQWQDLTGSIGPQPGPREQAGLAYDAADSESVLFGGSYIRQEHPGFTYRDTWAYRAGAWVNITPSSAVSPLPRAEFSMTGSIGGHVVLFGGYDLAGCSGTYLTRCADNRTWLYFDGAWNDMSSLFVGAPPGIQTDAPMTWDPIDGYGVYLDDFQSTWLLRWDDSLPTLALTPASSGVATGGTILFAVVALGGTPPYNLTLCGGGGPCTNMPSVVKSAVLNWSPTFPSAGNWTVYGRLVDANGSATTAGVTVRVANVTGTLTAALTVLPVIGVSPLNASVWVNVSGGAPPYTISLQFGDGSFGSALTSVRVSHLYVCPPPPLPGAGGCSYFLGANVVDTIGESWVSPSITMEACAGVVDPVTCQIPTPAPPSPSGPVKSLHLTDPRYAGGYAFLLLGGGVAGLAVRRRRRASEEGEARQLLRQLEVEESNSKPHRERR